MSVGRHNQTLTVLDSDLTTPLAGARAVCLSPAADSTPAAAMHWLNHSLPAQSRCRVYSEDGTPLGSTSLRRGRPNSLKSGLPSPLQRSFLASTAAAVHAVEKEVAVIDTSPILSTYCVSSSAAARETSEYVASVCDDGNGSTLVDSGLKVDADAPIETTLDDSTHNQAFTESMLADPNLADSSSVDSSYTDAVDCDRDEVVSCRDVSKLSLPVLSESSVVQLSNPAVSTYRDPTLKPIQSSTTSLDSAIGGEAEGQLGLERSILRSSSKQSIISHDSGVGLVDVLSPRTQLISCEAPPSHWIGRRSSARRQSVNLQVTTDVRHFLSKAGVPLEPVVIGKENADSAGEPRAGPKLLQYSAGTKVTSECGPTPCVKVPPSGHRPSKLVPVLPISTSLVRVSSERYSQSAKRHLTSSSAVPAAAASPAMSTTGGPRIKSALLTPSCLTGVDGTSQLRSRLRGRPAAVKRLQSSSSSSPYPNHSPVNPLSPRHVTTSAHTTVAVPFDIDV